ncbi:MCE family protein [Mycobacterium koreense]|nr:MCE family protein [Mycolicibacillus koreensis]MCV7249963.1 MCE family protein [Mycolicibacillus koreensis]BBY54681.1 putative Mce family protein [Mycolicibacillus koreensis]
MANWFDTDPRGASNPRLFVLGVCFITVAVATAMLMVAKSQGKLDDLVRVDIELTNIGDGLPPRSDVKFRNLLVGSVSDVTPSTHGLPNTVHVTIKPDYAQWIPDTVTARVVPANLFAVSAVQLVDNGEAPGRLRTGSVIREDQSLPTVIFQNVLNKLRQLIGPLGRKADDHSIGVIAALGAATHGRGRELTDTGHDLNEILIRLNDVVATDDAGPTTLSALTDAAAGLHRVSPELFDALDQSIRPMATITEKGQQLSSLLAGGLGTFDTLATALENQAERMITISTQLTPPLGVIADHSDEFHGVSTKLQNLAIRVYDIAWDPETKVLKAGKAAIALTPSRSYVRADCPRYGELAGPSCDTAPETPTAPDLFPALESQGVQPTPGVTENRPNVTPPRHSMPGDPQGPPALPPPGPPPGPVESPPPVEAPAPPPLAAEVHPQSAIIGGNVGVVGSAVEKNQIARIAGRSDTSTVLLLGPLLRGSTVQISPVTEEGR